MKHVYYWPLWLLLRAAGWSLVLVAFPLVMFGYLLTIPLDWIERRMKLMQGEKE
jgi:hypothetical protein